MIPEPEPCLLGEPRRRAAPSAGNQGRAGPRADIDLAVIADLLNSALTSIARWYRPAGRLKAAQVAGKVMKLLRGLLISAPPG